MINCDKLNDYSSIGNDNKQGQHYTEIDRTIIYNYNNTIVMTIFVFQAQIRLTLMNGSEPLFAVIFF